MSRLMLLTQCRSPQAYTNKIKQIASANLIAYWPLADTSGTTATDESGNGRSGAYSNVVLGQPGIGDGRPSAQFTIAASGWMNAYSASLAAAWNGQEFTIAYWCKPTSWSGSPFHRPFTFRADGNNQITAGNGSANTLTTTYIAGGTSKAINITTSTLAWFFYAITISKTADAMKVYFYDSATPATPLAQIGSTQTGLGTYVGTLDPTLCQVGCAGATPMNFLDGWMQHVALWNTPLSLTQLAALATI